MKIKNPRNKPCQCGSGKKYKKCCGNPAVIKAKQDEEDRAFRERMRQRHEELKAEHHPEAKRRVHNPILATVLMAGALMGGFSAAPIAKNPKSY